MRLLIAVSVTAVLAACGGSSAPVDESLARDLERVGSSSFELAPAASGTQVMSALELDERAPNAAPAPSPERKRVAQRSTAPKRPQTRTAVAAPRAVQQDPAPAEERVAQNPAPQPAAALPAPTSAPLGAGPAPPGGWKSVGTVIRNSRVPINP